MKKYLSNSKIGKQPEEVLKVHLGEKVVKENNLADKSVSVNKLGEDVTAVIQDIEHYGVMVAQEFGSNANISISQKKLTEEVQSIHAILDSNYYDN